MENKPVFFHGCSFTPKPIHLCCCCSCGSHQFFSSSSLFVVAIIIIVVIAVVGGGAAAAIVVYLLSFFYRFVLFSRSHNIRTNIFLRFVLVITLVCSFSLPFFRLCFFILLMFYIDIYVQVETVGDKYMAVSGLPEACENHAKWIAKLALDMMDMAKYVQMGTEPVVSQYTHTHTLTYICTHNRNKLCYFCNLFFVVVVVVSPLAHFATVQYTFLIFCCSFVILIFDTLFSALCRIPFYFFLPFFGLQNKFHLA